MNFKQCFFLVAAITGILLVVLSPRWYYPPHPLMPQERNIGYGLITQPPKPLGVFREENGQRYDYINQSVAPRIDRVDLSMRIGLIIATTVCGLWILQVRKKHIKKRQPI